MFEASYFWLAGSYILGTLTTLTLVRGSIKDIQNQAFDHTIEYLIKENMIKSKREGEETILYKIDEEVE